MRMKNPLEIPMVLNMHDLSARMYTSRNCHKVTYLVNNMKFLHNITNFITDQNS